jgi:predicted AlkP superfamily phosphohydrolase/phosphomutase
MMVIGLDGLCVKMFRRFEREGLVPNMSRLARRGSVTRLMSVVPAQTPTNWTTLATGAYPGTHGVSVWGTHERGAPPGEHRRDEAMSSNICRAEYMWEAAARNGLRSLLVNYVGYPPTSNGTTFIEWAQGPTAFHFQIALPETYRRPEPRPNVAALELGEATGWKDLPKTRKKPLAGEIVIAPRRSKKTVTFHLAVVAGGSGGYDTVIISPRKDARGALRAKAGKWTGWMTHPFSHGSKRVDGTVRFKLMELNSTASKLALYRTQIYPLEGFTYPADVGRELTRRFGPFIHEAAWNSWTRGLCDAETAEEELVYHAEWIGRAVAHLWDKLDVRVYYQHMHLLDSLNHSYLSAVDPTGAGYGKIPEKKGWEAFRLGYRMVDRMVGEVSKVAGPDTVVAVLSDHGDVPNRRAVSLVNLFVERGWIRARKGPDGKPVIDNARSKVHFAQNHIWINLEGREPEGCVKPSEYRRLQTEIVDELLDFKDPKDGTRAIGLALSKEDAVVLGMYGPAVGDVVFYYNQHYRWSGPEVLGMGIKELVWDDPGGANHGCQPPNCQTEVSDNAGALILAGPGVRRNYERDTEEAPPMFTADVVPTVARLAGLEPPIHAEGKVVRDLMTGYRGKMKRSRRRITGMPFSKPVRRPKKLAGDVTDEE